jgi:hypothetical protein
MSTIIRPGDPLHSALVSEQARQGGRVVEHEGNFYLSAKGGDGLIFSLITIEPEKDSFGRKMAHLRAPYPPEG